MENQRSNHVTNLLQILFSSAVIAAILLPANMVRGQQELQRLYALPDSYYMVTADGEPFFWCGDTLWWATWKFNRDDVVHYVTTRVSQGYNVFAINLSDRHDQTNVYGDKIFNQVITSPAVTPGNDPNDPAQYDYWDHIDYIATTASQHGMYIGMVVLWGGQWVVEGAEKVTPSEAEIYGQFLGNRYGSYTNMIFILGGDTGSSSDYQKEIWRSLARGIAVGATGSEDYSNLFMTHHPGGHQISGVFFHNDPWLDVNDVYTFWTASYNLTQNQYNNFSPPKPIFGGEPRYETAVEDGHVVNALVTRNIHYWACFAGTIGQLYGHDRVWNVSGSWRSSLHDGAGPQMKYLRYLFESRPPFNRVPDRSIITAGGGSDVGYWSHFWESNMVWALRSTDGSHCMLYTPDGHGFSVDMSALAHTVKAWWYNPRDGSATLIGTYPNTGSQSFTPPQGGTDWVLVLDDETENFPPPGTVCAPPTAPANPQITYADLTHIDLTWEHNSPDEDGFIVQRRPRNGVDDWSTLAELGPDVTSYSDTGLIYGATEYHYRVGAFNDCQ